MSIRPLKKDRSVLKNKIADIIAEVRFNTIPPYGDTYKFKSNKQFANEILSLVYGKTTGRKISLSNIKINKPGGQHNGKS